MKRIASLVILIIALAVPARAGVWDFITKPLRLDISAVKQEIKGDVNGVKADVAKLADIQVRMHAELKAQINSVAKGIAGVNNTMHEVTTTVGRDQTISTVNDTALLKEYIGLMRSMIDIMAKVIGVQFGAMIALLSWIIKFLLRADKARDEREAKEVKKGGK